MLRSLLICFFLAASFFGFSQPPVISFQNLNIAGLSQPLDMVNAGDGSGRMFIVQRTGLVKIWTGGTTTSNFLNVGVGGENIIRTTGSEEGLLSIAFHPAYDGVTNRYFFVYYTDTNGDLALRRYETTIGDPNLADVATDVLLLTIPHPTNTNHNGAKLNFGADGYLYFATGDGGGGGDAPNNAQTGISLLGKMLRLDIDNTSSYGNYAVPASNPYNTDASIDDRIFALGLRNPFRWSFDRLNGNIWIGDVGQGAWEEVNMRTAADAANGTNYGWRCYEGLHTYNISGCLPQASYTSPVFEYANGAGSAAVTGGYVYRGTEYPNLYGYYLAADVYSGNIYVLWPNGSGGFNSTTQAAVQTNIVGFAEAEDGTLYAVSIGGAVFKVVATGGTILPVKLGSFTGKQFAGYNELQWSTTLEQGTSKFIVEFSTDGIGYNSAGTIAASGNADGGNYHYKHYTTAPTVFYRLKMVDADGRFSYGPVLKLSGGGKDLSIYPTVVDNGMLTISSALNIERLQLVNSNGAIVFEKRITGAAQALSIYLPSLPKGIYIVQVAAGNQVAREKIIIR